MGGGGTPKTKNYYYYKIQLPYQSISPDKAITFYNAYGELVMTLPPYSSDMDYGTGLYTVPGDKKREDIIKIASASFNVKYGMDKVVIDYDNATFYISQALVSQPTSVTLWATFEYMAIFSASNDTAKIMDGDWNTQMQTIFYAPPPSGYEYALLDLGGVVPIQAIDLVGGYFRPTDTFKFDCKYNASLKYSLDGEVYYTINNDLTNFEISSGEAKSFDEDKIGVGFKARYIKILLEEVNKINYGKSSITVTQMNYNQLVDAGLINPNDPKAAKVGDTLIIREGLYAVALTEASVYSDIILKSECLLIPTTRVTDIYSNGDIEVLSTDGFDDSGIAYLSKDSNKYFNYTSRTSNVFQGVTFDEKTEVSIGEWVTKDIETVNSLYDTTMILSKLGDRVYKKNNSSTEYLYTQSNLDYLAKEYLKEFVKNHDKVSIDMAFAPYIKIGDTISLTDEYNRIDNERFFVESVTHSSKSTQLVVARYPA